MVFFVYLSFVMLLGCLEQYLNIQIGKYVEAFEEGMSFKDVEKKTADMLSRKTKLEARKRAVSK